MAETASIYIADGTQRPRTDRDHSVGTLRSYPSNAPLFDLLNNSESLEIVLYDAET
jgi:hypothetical protein